ncbi:MAG: hypothetical protein AXA67_13095 [Methylothermaceae bacteria B42]|nr:MAG: hypothetical protein AXA67_13095 [Methylothermaceae bacteria B42]HHJ38439.1 biotin/lipoyl-binding protein [Methylothermaceae bacterium]
MKDQYQRYWPWALLALGFLLFVVLILTRPRPPALAVRERVWQVEAVTVNPRALRPVLTLYGQVESPDLVQAAAPGKARVWEVRVQEGEAVKSGQILLRLDPRDFEPQVVQTRSDVAELQAQLAQEKVRYASDLRALEHEKSLLSLMKNAVARAEKLLRKNLLSAAAVDKEKAEYERQSLAVVARQLAVNEHKARLTQLEAKLQRAQAALETAQLALERSQVIAPFDGVVAKVEVAAGDFVQSHQVLLSFYPWRGLELRARIPTPFQAEIQQALARQNHLPAQGESAGIPFTALLSRLSGSAAAGGIDALFEITGGNEHLRLGMTASLVLQRPPRENAVPLPYAALYGSNRVYKIVDGRLQPVKVTILGDYAGDKQGSWLLVASRQLHPGDKVLVTHLPNAAAGLPVEIKAKK